jgi:hypothetical protein
MKEIILSILGFIILVAVVFIGVNTMARKNCLSAYSNYQAEYSFWKGCRIMVDGKMTPTDIVRELK